MCSSDTRGPRGWRRRTIGRGACGTPCGQALTRRGKPTAGRDQVVDATPNRPSYHLVLTVERHRPPVDDAAIPVRRPAARWLRLAVRALPSPTTSTPSRAPGKLPPVVRLDRRRGLANGHRRRGRRPVHGTAAGRCGTGPRDPPATDARSGPPRHESEAAPRSGGAGLRGLEIGLPSVHMGAVVDDLGVSSLRLLTQIPRAETLSRRASRGCPVLESGITRREDGSSPRCAPGLRGFP